MENSVNLKLSREEAETWLHIIDEWDLPTFNEDDRKVMEAISERLREQL